jgi:YVTN family beta-propeller protein
MVRPNAVRAAALAAACAGILFSIGAAERNVLFPILKSAVAIGAQPDGTYLLATNQLLRPWGERTLIPGRPVDLALDARRGLVAVLNWRSVVLLDAASGARVVEVRTKPTSYAGIAFRPGSRELWISEASRNGPDAVAVIAWPEKGNDPDDGAPAPTIDRIALEGHPLPVGIAFSADGATAYVALSRDNALAVFDAASRKLVRKVAVGIAPFGVVAAKAGRIFVSNRGGRRPMAGDTVAPSGGSMVVTDRTTGASASGTLTAVDAKTFSTRDVAVGLAPAQIALSPDERTMAVANAHSDSVSLVDTESLKRADVSIPAWPENTMGSQPNAVAWAPDGRRLYVACGGTNAIAVLAAGGSGAAARGTMRVAGAIPTGWFPSGIAVDQSGSLRVLSIKGTGNTSDAKGTFSSLQFEGLMVKLPPPLEPQLAAGVREVRAANEPRYEPMTGGVADLTSLGIRHVFLIIKENRTYDQVFGDMGKGESDASLVMYGRAVTPNHHALAEQYLLLDNFHTGGAISFDGHQWLMQAFVSDYVERAFAASPRGYAWNMEDALTVAPTGFFWQNAPRPLSVRIYGEFSLPARWDPLKQDAVDMNEDDVDWSAYWRLYKEGKWEQTLGAKCAVPVLEPYFSKRFPFGSTSIPDQIRAEEFLRELAEHVVKDDLPNLSIISLDSDHTNGRRPGSPTPKAMVADNDLAMGRMVEGISKTKYWASSLILVVEDDAQDGVDHVDGHRTVALAIGPAVRRGGAVDSTFYNHTSMVRTIQEVFGIPQRTRFLKAARAMHSVFTRRADLSPYAAVVPQQPLDQMNPSTRGLHGRDLWAARESARMRWGHVDDVPEETLNRILWGDAKGWSTPYPTRAARP